MTQLVYRSVFDESVGQSYATHSCSLAIVTQPFEHSRTETTCKLSVFNGDDAAEALRHALKHIRIKRFAETHVVVCHAERAPFSSQLAYCCLHIISYRTITQYSHVAAVTYLSGLTNRNGFQLAMPVVAFHSLATRIAYHHRAHTGQLGCVHHSSELAFVHRRAQREVGNGTQSGNVEHAMMRRSVLANKSGAVETEYNGEIKDGCIVYDIVVSTLCEGTVYVAERHQSVLCHTRCKRGGMSFGNADIKHTVGHCMHHYVHRASRWHGWSDAYDVGIGFGKFKKRSSEHFLILQWIWIGSIGNAFTGLGVELAGGMPYGSLAFGGFITFAFDGVEVEQFGAAHILQLFEYAHSLAHIVAVEGSEVAYVHSLKDILLMRESRLQGIVKTNNALATVVVEIAHGVQPLGSLVAQAVVSGIGVEIKKILLHTSNSTVDAHIVVVEHNKQVVGRRRHVVESLKSEPTRHGTIAYHCHYMTVVVSGFACSDSHTERCRNGVGSVSTRECVVLALHRSREWAYAMQFAVGAERVFSAG